MSGMGKSQPLRIIPELRSNALFISGPSEQVNDIMAALEVLDTNELPESAKDRVPRMIPVEVADVTEVASIIKEVYKEQMDPVGGNPLAALARGGGGGGGGGFNPLAMMLGGEGLVLDAQALAAIEDRTRRVRDHEVLALARALQVTVDELLPQRVRKPRV